MTIESIAFAPATDGLLLVAFLLAAPAGEATCPTSDDGHGSHHTMCLARHATPAAKPEGKPGGLYVSRGPAGGGKVVRSLYVSC